ncbi:GATA zinc finger domain-containing protein 14-like [Mercenaria mercenaria]|uniref:GATA zinc finger domain-containing protein 14-like n=1 Tax=Mercenaria mercenaria TaxID=6596 RepID=UPI00234E7181|nr:GATA zinc finger domain-containing protein 14-like [Mercenaria mercenaria]
MKELKRFAVLLGLISYVSARYFNIYHENIGESSVKIQDDNQSGAENDRYLNEYLNRCKENSAEWYKCRNDEDENNNNGYSDEDYSKELEDLRKYEDNKNWFQDNGQPSSYQDMLHDKNDMFLAKIGKTQDSNDMSKEMNDMFKGKNAKPQEIDDMPKETNDKFKGKTGMPKDTNNVSEENNDMSRDEDGVKKGSNDVYYDQNNMFHGKNGMLTGCNDLPQAKNGVTKCRYFVLQDINGNVKDGNAMSQDCNSMFKVINGMSQDCNSMFKVINGMSQVRNENQNDQQYDHCKEFNRRYCNGYNKLGRYKHDGRYDDGSLDMIQNKYRYNHNRKYRHVGRNK